MELLKLSANYPNPKTQDELQILSNLWLEDFSHIAEEIFLEAIKLHRRRSRFFPTIADVLELYQEVVRNTHKPIALPEPMNEPSPADVTERKRLISEIKQKRKK